MTTLLPRTATPLPRTRIAHALAAVLLLAPTVGAAQEPAPAQPGWLGLWLRCDSCHVSRSDGTATWEFHDLPVVVSVVDESPARSAGFEVGDTIVRINGVALSSDAGGRHFGAIRAGQAVTFVLRRNGAERTVRLVPAQRPENFEEMRKREEVEKETRDDERVALRPEMRAHLDSMLPRLREHLDSLHHRWRLDMWHDSLAHDHERWMQLYRDSIRIQLDSLAIRVLPMPEAPRAPRVGVRYELRTGDTTSAVPVWTWNAVAGAQMTSLGEELGEYFPGSDGGVLVLRVLEGTPAANAGLKPGDVIVAVRGQRVRSVEDVRKALKPYPRPVQCEVVRKGQKVNVTIEGALDPRSSGPSSLFPGAGASGVPRSSPSGPSVFHTF